MSDSAFNPEFNSRSPESPQKSTTAQTQIRRLVWKIAFATLLLMAVGSATRVMNAGLACPDWPLCYGQLVPTQQMNLQVFLEWFHRLDAMLIGLSSLLLVGWTWWERKQLPSWLLGASIFAFGLILVQGALGAFTVTELLRFDIVTAHLGTALLFFSTMLTIGTYLLPDPSSNYPISRSLLWLPPIATICVYVQSLIGGLVGSRWALHQCLDNSALCQVMNSHIIGVVPATLSSIATVVLIWRNSNLPSYCRHLATLTGGLLVAQILLGVATFKLHLQVEPLTVMHQSIGATLLGTLVVLTVTIWRLNDASSLAEQSKSKS